VAVAHAHGHAENELRAHTRGAVHVNAATHQLDELFGNGQSQASATIAARHAAIGLHKGAEEARHGLGRNPDARVTHQELQLEARVDRRRCQAAVGGGVGWLVARGEADVHHHFTMLGELDGVGHQVGEHLTQAQRVTMDDGGQARLLAEAQLQALFVGARCHQLQRVFHQGAQHKVAVGQLQSPGLDLCEVQDVVDDLQQALARAVHGLRKAALLVVQGGAQQQLGHAQNAVHGRSDLMAHVGHELALGLAGAFGGIPRPLQFQSLGVLIGHVRQQTIDADLSIIQAPWPGAMAHPAQPLAWHLQPQQGVGMEPLTFLLLLQRQGWVIIRHHA